TGASDSDLMIGAFSSPENFGNFPRGYCSWPSTLNHGVSFAISTIGNECLRNLLGLFRITAAMHHQTSSQCGPNRWAVAKTRLRSADMAPTARLLLIYRFRTLRSRPTGFSSWQNHPITPNVARSFAA